MQTMSKNQAQLMNALLSLAGGDSTLVEQAFEIPPREGTGAPDLLDIVQYILRETGREELIDQLKRRLGEGADAELAAV